MNESRYGTLALLGLTATVALLPSCRQTTPKVEAPPPRQSPAPQTEPAELTKPTERKPDLPQESIPEANTIGSFTVPAESDWLHVDAIRPKVDGGWATGDFFEQRNKIEIHTRGVKQFSIDLGKLKINWDRLVVIGIDGRNAELRKRDVDVIHIARDEHGKWVVWEP